MPGTNFSGTLRTSLWTETQSLALSSDGYFATFLGQVTPLTPSVISGADIFLEVTVQGAGALGPRQRLGSVAFAHQASRLEGRPAADFVLGTALSTPGTVNTSTNPVDWSKLKNVPATLASGAVQSRVTGTCSGPAAIQSIAANGTVTCSTPAASIGPPATMYIEGDPAVFTCSTLPLCPTGWLDWMCSQTTGVGGAALIRRCVYEGPMACAVLYLETNQLACAGLVPCPGGWTDAGCNQVNRTGGNTGQRVCYRCR